MAWEEAGVPGAYTDILYVCKSDKPSIIIYYYMSIWYMHALKKDSLDMGVGVRTGTHPDYTGHAPTPTTQDRHPP